MRLMAKTRVKIDRQALENSIRRKLDEVRDEDQLKTEIGLFLTERIRFQARVGKPLNDDGRFPPLKDKNTSKGGLPSTVERREYLSRFNKTDSTFASRRSNLTFTGQLLDGLAFNRVKNGIDLLFKGKRKPYRTGPKSRERNPLSNAELDVELRKIGFFAFTKPGIEANRKITRQISRIVSRFLRRKL